MAFGCFGLVAGMLPAFVYEKMIGVSAPDAVITVLAVLGGTAGLLWGFSSTWRDVGSEPRRPRPRRSLREYINDVPFLRPPPWEAPRYVEWLSPDDEVREQLEARLDHITVKGHDPAGTRTDYFRDRHTGQLWQQIYCEQGFGSGYAYAPVDPKDLPT